MKDTTQDLFVGFKTILMTVIANVCNRSETLHIRLSACLDNCTLEIL